jgi:hypothetical protein
MSPASWPDNESLKLHRLVEKHLMPEIVRRLKARPKTLNVSSCGDLLAFRLVINALSQAHLSNGFSVKVTAHAQAVATLITPKRLAHLGTESSVVLAVIIAFPREAFLRCLNGRVV